MKFSTGFLYLLIAWICFWLPGYLHGKSVADRWYAEHWHPNVRLSDVLDESRLNKFMANGVADDVTVIGHGITIVNSSHVVVIQCSEETIGAMVAIGLDKPIVCSGERWLPVEGVKQ